ncbi:MAG: glycosyltransferase [Rubripirellula sp.]|nr:glycosyltransferase [Rubripirellula sp.]
MFVITSMPVGGAETLLVNMIRRIDPNRIRAEVVCTKTRGPLGEQLANEFPVHANLLHHKWDLRVLPRLIRLFRRRRADAVITVGAGDKMFWGRLAAWFAGVPVIASALHSTGWPDGVGRMNRCLTPITDAWIAVADSHGEFLSQWEKFPAERVQVIRNGIDCSTFKPDVAQRGLVRKELGLADEVPLIGIIAALRSEKNHIAFIQMAERLRDRFPTAHWVIVGDGPERPAIEAEIAKRGLADRVHLLGTRHDTPRLLAALDLFTLCSHNEASPVSILEALACEIPVVATDVGSVAESVIEGRTGRLVPPGDLDAFCEATTDLLIDSSKRARFGVDGRQRVLESGSLEAMVRGYEQLVTEIYDAKAISREHEAKATEPCLPRDQEYEPNGSWAPTSKVQGYKA